MGKCQLLCGPDCQHITGCMSAGSCLREVDGTRAPTNAEEYRLRFLKNQKVTGIGAKVCQHMPCPGCAAANWLAVPLLKTQEVLDKGRVCEECHRGFKTLTDRNQSGVQFEIVQYTGPACPDWLKPAPRRVGE